MRGSFYIKTKLYLIYLICQNKFFFNIDLDCIFPLLGRIAFMLLIILFCQLEIQYVKLHKKSMNTVATLQ
jgi:hypothetical protein